MKKLLITLSSILITSVPILLSTSCSASASNKINFNDQYDLFTEDLLIQEEVSKNLYSAILIDVNLIKNIYISPTLAPNISFIFSVEKTSDNNSLKLFVEIYDEKNNLINYSTESKKKEITIISGFRELSSEEQLIITDVETKFSDLKFKPIANSLPSFINDIKMVTSDKFIENNNYNYDWIFHSDDEKGELLISLILKDKNNYPLLKVESKPITGFGTTITYQKIIDDMYKEMPDDIDLSNELYVAAKKQFASSIVDNSELNELYEYLNTLNIPDDKKLTIPKYIQEPGVIPGFYVKISLESYDKTGRLTIFIDIYNTETGELLVPTKSSSKSRNINYFKKAEEEVDGKKVDNNELLKAIMIAYDKFSVHQLNDLNEYDVNFIKLLPTLSKYDVQKYIDSVILSLPEGDISTGSFNIVVDKFIITEPKIVEPTTKKTFTFRVKINPSSSFNDEDGSINTKINIEYKEGDEWFLVRPSSRVSLNDNGSPSFSKTKQINELVISGFLTNKLSHANELYEYINKCINSKIFISSVPYNEFDKTNFDSIWKSMSTNDADQLGIIFKKIENYFSIKYEFAKDPLNDLEYKIIETIAPDGSRVKTVSIKVIVCSFTNPEFEFEFLNLNNLDPVPSFEFDFSIKSS